MLVRELAQHGLKPTRSMTRTRYVVFRNTLRQIDTRTSGVVVLVSPHPWCPGPSGEKGRTRRRLRSPRRRKGPLAAKETGAWRVLCGPFEPRVFTCSVELT